MKKSKKILALLLASAMSLSLLAGCGDKQGEQTQGPGVENTQPVVDTPTYEKVEFDGQKYTYRMSASTMPSNWNPQIGRAHV